MYVVEADGYTFLFAYDRHAPELLHIYARHLVQVDDALEVFFDPTAREVWNQDHRRWETTGHTHVLYWCYTASYGPDPEPDRRVLIITCFPREDLAQ
jgi:hypothetical protein